MLPPAYSFLQTALAVLLIMGIHGCSRLPIRSISQTEAFDQNHVGFFLFDPAENKVIAELNAGKYFTPASNTKIFTFYTCLQVLGDSIPAFRYYSKKDSLVLWGTGDPTLLHPDFGMSLAFEFLKSQYEPIYISMDNFDDSRFGPGWAWDDYSHSFQPEKSSLPIYGNMVRVVKEKKSPAVLIEPQYFKTLFSPDPDSASYGSISRSYDRNLFYYGLLPDSIEIDRELPFITDNETVAHLLRDTLHRDVKIISSPFNRDSKTIYSVPVDSVYKKLMQESDNFLAEQLLLLAANEISDTLRTQIAINYAIDSLLPELPDKPIWVDGSGLSRYNLFTPRSIVKLWEMIYRIVPEERLFELIAVGGQSGTIENWYESDPPYIFGKTGTLNNNHCLSGFLKTRKRKTLIFSFMHNNYAQSSSAIKAEMQRILWEVHENY